MQNITKYEVKKILIDNISMPLSIAELNVVAENIIERIYSEKPEASTQERLPL